ncbi:hypothetical protein [Companilactobacillus sp. DQM5]|uniref:hypothetical protein n=1 Tax=Companilactobacillus sp. DQM5 TaxID=3463359 RepID=UPI0040591130
MLRYKTVANYIENLLREYKNSDRRIEELTNECSDIITIGLSKNIRNINKFRIVIDDLLNRSLLFNQIYKYIYKISDELGFYITDNILHY